MISFGSSLQVYAWRVPCFHHQIFVPVNDFRLQVLQDQFQVLVLSFHLLKFQELLQQNQVASQFLSMVSLSRDDHSEQQMKKLLFFSTFSR